jgi:CheY-like chemotaxis protein
VRVLVVDDLVDHADSLCAMLEAFGCRTCQAYGAATAMRMAELFHPDILMIDFHMPGATGCELLSELRTLSPLLDRAIFIAISGDREAEPGCLGAGFDFFFLKPIDPQQLDAVLFQTKALADLRGRRAAAQPSRAKAGGGRGGGR